MHRAMLLGLAGVLSWAGPALAGDAQRFVTPGHWTVGAAGSTHQHWDVIGQAVNTPDVAWVASPGLTEAPTLSVVSPGMALGSGNFYSFSADYGVAATIHNHGGAYGDGATPGWGTHVIVQTVSTLNEGVGVDPLSLLLTDLRGNALLGGAAADALQSAVLFTGIVNTSQGDVEQEERIWEFFLPGYTGDFQVVADVRVHSSFRALQVDTLVSESALPITTVPEPAALLMVLAGGGALALRRRWR